jgi:hypothetical protein
MWMLISLSFNDALPVFVVIQSEYIVMYCTCKGEEQTYATKRKALYNETSLSLDSSKNIISVVK